MRDTLPGGRYRAEQNQDGTWNLLEVPIMATGPMRLENGDPFDIDEAWLRRALAIGKSREAEGYASPLHVNHHETGEVVEGAGQIVLRGIREGTLDGKPTPMLFANLIRVLPYVYERIRMGALAYRSFESLNVHAGEVDCLALMAHQPPRFKLPLLTVGEEIPFAATGNPPAPVPMMPQLRVAAARPRTPFAYRAEATTMPDEKKDEKPPEKDPKKDEGAKGQEEAPGWAKEMLELLKKMAASCEGKAAASAEPAKAPPVGQPANLGTPAAAAAAAGADSAELRGQVIALGGRVEAMEREKARCEAVRIAHAGLKGLSLGPTVEADLAAAYAGGGQAELDRTVASIRKHAAKEPTKDGGLDTNAADDASLPAAVLAHAKAGPDALERASRIYREEYLPLEGVTSLSIDSFLAARMNGAGARVKA